METREAGDGGRALLPRMNQKHVRFVLLFSHLLQFNSSTDAHVYTPACVRACVTAAETFCFKASRANVSLALVYGGNVAAELCSRLDAASPVRYST